MFFAVNYWYYIQLLKWSFDLCHLSYVAILIQNSAFLTRFSSLLLLLFFLNNSNFELLLFNFKNRWPNPDFSFLTTMTLCWDEMNPNPIFLIFNFILYYHYVKSEKHFRIVYYCMWGVFIPNWVRTLVAMTGSESYQSFWNMESPDYLTILDVCISWSDLTVDIVKVLKTNTTY